MAFITYKQADSRWGKKNYNGSSTMATAGCGPTACAMIAYGINGKTTPLDTMKYMQKHGYAIRNNGTAWNGIPSCLKAFGLQNVQEVPNMTKCWELMKQGYVGVFLFRAGSRGGVRWTSSGHYIAVTGYKVEKGKHYVYTRDSGGRNHTGWYAYETTMKGLIPRIWLGKLPAKASAPATPSVKKPSGKYGGSVPNPTLKKGSKGDSVKLLQKFLNWYYPSWKLSVDGSFGPKTDSALRGFQKTEGIGVDGVYGKNSYAKAKAYVYVAPKPTPSKATLKSYRIEVDLTNQICTVYGIYSDGSKKGIMSEFVSTARKGKTTPTGNFKIQGASGGRKAKARTALMSGGNSYAEYLCRFHGGKCMHTVPYKKRQTTGHVNKTEFNKLGSVASAGCVRMPWKLAHYIYTNCPIGTPVIVFKGKAGSYPMGKPTKYKATSDVDPTYKK